LNPCLSYDFTGASFETPCLPASFKQGGNLVFAGANFLFFRPLLVSRPGRAVFPAGNCASPAAFDPQAFLKFLLFSFSNFGLFPVLIVHTLDFFTLIWLPVFGRRPCQVRRPFLSGPRFSQMFSPLPLVHNLGEVIYLVPPPDPWVPAFSVFPFLKTLSQSPTMKGELVAAGPQQVVFTIP